MAIGEKTIFSPERFKMNFQEREAIGILCKNRYEVDKVIELINKYYPLLNNISETKILMSLAEAESWISVYSNGEEFQICADTAAGFETFVSDYYFEDIIFQKINEEELLKILLI